MLPANIIYLENSGTVIEGLKIWGSPVTPYFMDMAFNKRRGAEIKKIWNKIPNNLDVLITHGPPKDIFDNGLGCEDLSNKLKIAKPKFHIFGHIHEHNGRKEINGTTYINAALVNDKGPLEVEYKLVGSPHIFLL
jgi:Icc-related predicted phosphoesterase